ncbi:MAG: hypothetical protein ACRDV3_06010 [Acidothermaceae bacterium]
MSQRTFTGMPSSGAAAMAQFAALTGSAASARVAPVDAAGATFTSSALVFHPVESALRAPVERAYNYLNFVMDAYAQGNTLRLLQSYNNESGLLTTGFGYDNALALMAYLACPTSDHLRRAKVLGDSLLFAQATDRARDGRVRQAYVTGPVLSDDGVLTAGFVGDRGAVPAHQFGFTGTSTGDAAWVGLALAQLYAHTHDRRYLDGAVDIGQFIVDTATSPYHHGGYLGGVGADGSFAHQWSSTEHNVDAYALFQMLEQLTGEHSWHDKANRARSFVVAMWEAAGGFFYTGTQNPATTYPQPGAGLAVVAPNGSADEINKAPIPEDVQTWSYLSLAEHAFAHSIDWAATKLSNTDSFSSSRSGLPAGYSVSGVTFSDRSKALSGAVPGGASHNNRDAVWIEGTAHLAAALRFRQSRGRHGQGQGQGELSDRSRALSCLTNCVSVQSNLGTSADLAGRPQTVGLTSRADGALCGEGHGGVVTGTALPPRSGIVAASSDLDTGFGFGYFTNQHVGATSWFLLAALAVNPFRL